MTAAGFDSFDHSGFDSFIHSGFDARGVLDDTPIVNPGTCHGCNYQNIADTRIVTMSNWVSGVNAASHPCCNCIGFHNPLNGIHTLTRGSSGSIGVLGPCDYGKQDSPSLEVGTGCSCSGRRVFAHIIMSVEFSSTWTLWVVFASTFLQVVMRYVGPENECGFTLNPSGLYTYSGTIVGFPSQVPCLQSWPTTVVVS